MPDGFARSFVEILRPVLSEKAMDSNGLKFWMLSQQQDWPLPPPALAGSGPNLSSLGLSASVGDTQIVLETPLPGGAPDFVSIDGEIMAVNGIDPSGLQLGVTRGALGTLAASHATGALVLGPVGLLAKPAAIDDTQITVFAAPHPPTTTATTTPGPTTTALTTTLAPVPPPPGQLAPGVFVEIGAEVLAVTQVDPSGTVAAVTRGTFGSTPAAYPIGTPVFTRIAANTLYYCTSSNRLRLVSMRIGNPPIESFPAAGALVEQAPMARDAFGNYARWDSGSSQIMAGGSAPGEVAIYAPPIGQTVTDLAMGNDGILYIAVGGSLVLIDRRGRWSNFTFTSPGFNFWRLAALPDEGVLALDRAKPQLGKVVGAPLQTGPLDTPNPGILRSCQANPQPTQLIATYPLPGSETFVALTNLGDRFVLLSWAANSALNTASFLRIFDFTAGLGTAWKLNGILWPYAIAALGDLQVAVLATGLSEALVYDLSQAASVLLPAGDAYVLSGQNKGPFAHTLSVPPYYADGTQLKPLLPLSLNSLAGYGTTDARAPKIVDSGKSQAVWHRLFLEAIIPPRCSVVVWLTAADQPAGITAASASWYPIAFGDADMQALPADTPQGVWLSIQSEVPFAQPMLDETPQPNRQGLFMALIQRAGRAVRNLSGRFLGIRVELFGDRRATPEIAALRAWGSRFSYVSNYLPELYRENKFGAEADRPGPSTRRDFFERFVNVFEAQLTRIEDRVANSYLLTRAESAPDEALDWLGGWVGLSAAGYPPDRRRARLRASHKLHKQRGTVDGVTHAINIATNGLAKRGAVIVIEDFRLRHIFATILGANLATDNPLLPGHSPSSNSFVGDTLFLGDPRDQAEILALFSAELPESGAEQAAVERFFDSLANRVTIFIHNQVESVDINLVQKIVDHEKPAHVAAAIRIATQPFMVGLAALLGVDSYLAPEPPREPVVVGSSQIGRYSMVIQAPSLDPRLEI
jgi:phage tail-like protein